jgi:hypothetical protein
MTKKYPSYDVNALRQNLKKCDANIKIFLDAIEKEENAKGELKELITLCKERDEELRKLAEKAGQ